MREWSREFAAALAATADRRGVFGRDLHFSQETGSTNDDAAALAQAGAAEGTAVVSLAQTAGRGRLGRAWFSPAGAGLYASVVLRDPRVVPLLTIAAGVAIAEGIRRATGLPVELKWPNDVVPPGDVRRKLAGILAEASTDASGVQYAIVGFGINLHAAAYPLSIADRATSIETELGRPADAPLVLAECLACLSEYVGRLARGDAASVVARWRTLSPSVQGTSVQWDNLRGTTAGIDDTGALLIRSGAQIHRVISGEVRWPGQR